MLTYCFEHDSDVECNRESILAELRDAPKRADSHRPWHGPHAPRVMAMVAHEAALIILASNAEVDSLALAADSSTLGVPDKDETQTTSGQRDR